MPLLDEALRIFKLYIKYSTLSKELQKYTISKMIKSSRQDILAIESFDTKSQRSDSSTVTIGSWPTVENLTNSRRQQNVKKSCLEKLIGCLLLLIAYFILWACFYRDVQAQRKDWEFLRYKIICNSFNESFRCKLLQ